MKGDVPVFCSDERSLSRIILHSFSVSKQASFLASKHFSPVSPIYFSLLCLPVAVESGK